MFAHAISSPVLGITTPKRLNEAFERHQQAEIARLTQENADKDAEIARLKELLASMQAN